MDIDCRRPQKPLSRSTTTGRGSGGSNWDLWYREIVCQLCMRYHISSTVSISPSEAAAVVEGKTPGKFLLIILGSMEVHHLLLVPTIKL